MQGKHTFAHHLPDAKTMVLQGKLVAPHWTGVPNPNSPEQWPANAAPKAHIKVLSDARASAASFNAKQSKRQDPNPALPVSSLAKSEQAEDSHPNESAPNFSTDSPGQDSAAPEQDDGQMQQLAVDMPSLEDISLLDQQQSASHQLQAAAAAITDISAGVPTDAHQEADAANLRISASPAVPYTLANEQLSASHLLQAAVVAAVTSQPEEPVPESASEPSLRNEQQGNDAAVYSESNLSASASHLVQLAAAVRDGNSVPLNMSHGERERELHSASPRTEADIPTQTDNSGSAGQMNGGKSVDTARPGSAGMHSEASAAAPDAASPQQQLVAHDLAESHSSKSFDSAASQQQLTVPELAESHALKQAPDAALQAQKPQEPAAPALDATSNTGEKLPEAGSLPLQPFTPGSSPSAEDLAQESASLAASGLVPEHPVQGPPEQPRTDLSSEQKSDAGTQASPDLAAPDLATQPSGEQHFASEPEAATNASDPHLEPPHLDRKPSEGAFKWHVRPAASLAPPARPFNAQLQLAALDWTILDVLAQDLYNKEQQRLQSTPSPVPVQQAVCLVFSSVL